MGAGGEGQEWVKGEKLPSVLLSSFNVVLVESSPTTPQHQGDGERSMGVPDGNRWSGRTWGRCLRKETVKRGREKLLRGDARRRESAGLSCKCTAGERRGCRREKPQGG